MQRVGLNSGAFQQRVLFLYALCRRPGNVPASQLLTTCFYDCFDFRSLSPHSSSPFPCSWAVGPSALTRSEESSGNDSLKTIFRHPRVVFAAVPLSSSVLAPNQPSLDIIPAGARTEGLGKDDAEGRLMNENKILTTPELDSSCPIFLKGNSPSETDRTCKPGAETDSLGESSPTEWLMFQCMPLDFLDSFGCATIAGLRWPGPETIDGGPQ